MNEERVWKGSPFTDDEVKARIAASQEIGITDFTTRGGFSQENVFYLSFADGNLPKGKQWLGGCYIRADTMHEALTLSHALKINPGGNVRTTGPLPARVLRKEYEHRLLTTEEEIYSAADPSKL